ncbi:hypothetical protein MJG53_017764 [Ovis ammon polii x Ovis aries]|uniref:Uncharacterized protein n=1 Tax=Ovis ammon polii x Ovis aries TaxID=2918886 RepID=A0ACB9U5R9_9CETA|nr:hypothetical protein MJG53_017764 [Ovis ammon polii x Ovis aries]
MRAELTLFSADRRKRDRAASRRGCAGWRPSWRTRSCRRRPHLGSTPDLRFPVADQLADSSGNGVVLQHPQKGWLAALCDKPSKARTPLPPSIPWWAPCEAPAPSHCAPEVQTAKEQDWERAQQASVLGELAKVFQSDEGVSDGKGDRVTLFSPATQLSPSGQADAKTQSVRLQEQLDAINEEISLVEEEKENTEQRAEDTESREGRGRLGSLHHCKSGDTGSSRSEDLGVLYGNHSERMTLKLRLPALREEIGDDETAIKSKISTPAMPQSLRLDRLHTGLLRTANQGDIRDTHNSTGSEDSPENNPSNSTSRQDSLQKAPKKKGITSSIRRWFHRKEKGRPEHPGKEALAPALGRLTYQLLASVTGSGDTLGLFCHLKPYVTGPTIVLIKIRARGAPGVQHGDETRTPRRRNSNMGYVCSKELQKAPPSAASPR